MCCRNPSLAPLLSCVHRQKVEEASPLEGGRYYVHTNGTLEIHDAVEDDAGAYSCWVENAVGKTAVTATLDIRSISISFSHWLLCNVILLNKNTQFQFESLLSFFRLF